MATTSQGITTGAVSGAATGFSVGGPWGAVIGGIGGGLLGGFQTSKQNEAARKQAREIYDNALNYATNTYQEQKYLIDRQNSELKQQAETQINNRALNILQERGNLRNALISNNVGGNISKRLNSMSALTGATDIGIIEQNLSTQLFNQEMKKKQAKSQYLNTIKQGENQSFDILQTTKSDTLGTIASVAQSGLKLYSAMDSYGVFDSNNSSPTTTSQPNIEGSVNNMTVGRSDNNYQLQGFDNMTKIDGEATSADFSKGNPFNLGGNEIVSTKTTYLTLSNLDANSLNNTIINSFSDIGESEYLNNTFDKISTDTDLHNFTFKNNLYIDETFAGIQKEIAKRDNIIVKTNESINNNLIKYKENYTNKDTTGINKIYAPKTKEKKQKTKNNSYDYTNDISKNFLFLK